MGLYEKGLDDVTEEKDDICKNDREQAEKEIQKLLKEVDSLISELRVDSNEIVEKQGKQVISLICQFQAVLVKLEKLEKDENSKKDEVLKIKKEARVIIRLLKENGKVFFKIVLAAEKRLKET